MPLHRAGRRTGPASQVPRTWKVTYEARESGETTARRTFTVFEDAISGEAAAVRAYQGALSRGQREVLVLAVELATPRPGSVPV